MLIASRRRREVAELLYGGGVEVLDDADEQLDGAVVVLAVDDAVVHVGVADGHDQRNRGRAAVALLNFRGVIAVADDKFVLQRNRFLASRLPRQRYEFAVRQLAAV